MLCTPCKLAVEWGLAAVAAMGGPAEVPHPCHGDVWGMISFHSASPRTSQWDQERGPGMLGWWQHPSWIAFGVRASCSAHVLGAALGWDEG